MSNASGNNHPDSESVASAFQTVSGLTKWVACFLVISVVFLFVGAVFVGATKEVMEWSMYAVIVGLALFTLWGSFAVAREIHRQSKLAASQVRVLEEVNSFEDFFQRTERAPSVFRNHIANLYDIALSHTDVGQEKLIQIIQVRLRARNRLNELFASILTTLGLIGTIIGLIFMMSSLSHQVQDNKDDTQKMMSQLFDTKNGALSGLGLAFNTTLLGAVSGGVLLRILSTVVDANITHYTALIAELTEVHVLPPLRTLAEERAESRHAAKPVLGEMVSHGN